MPGISGRTPDRASKVFKPSGIQNPDKTVHGPMHFEPSRDLAERLNAAVRLAAHDDTDRRALLELMLLRPRPRQLTVSEREQRADEAGC